MNVDLFCFECALTQREIDLINHGKWCFVEKSSNIDSSGWLALLAAVYNGIDERGEPISFFVSKRTFSDKCRRSIQVEILFSHSQRKSFSSSFSKPFIIRISSNCSMVSRPLSITTVSLLNVHVDVISWIGNISRRWTQFVLKNVLHLKKIKPTIPKNSKNKICQRLMSTHLECWFVDWWILSQWTGNFC